MSQLQLSLLGTPVVKHDERTSLLHAQALALSSIWLWKVELTRAKHCPNRSGQSWTQSTGGQPYGLPCSSCASSLSALTDQASRLTCWLNAIHLDWIRAVRSSWTSTSSNLPASREGAGLSRWRARGMESYWRSLSRPRAWLAALSWQASHCATRNSSTIGLANTGSTGTCASISSLMPYRSCMKERGMGSAPSIP